MKSEKNIPPEAISNITEKTTESELLDAVWRWRYERLEYPGWIVAPVRKRRIIWRCTSHFFFGLLPRIKQWSALDQLLALRELNWRAALCMVPLFTEQLQAFEEILNQSQLLLTDSKSLPINSVFLNVKSAKSKELMEAWMELAFALMQEARECHKSDRWHELETQIETFIKANPEYEGRLYYEKSLWALANLEFARAKQLVVGWNPSKINLIERVWKSGLLAELGLLSEAQSLLETTLHDLRLSENRSGQNIRLFSIEAWCSYILQNLSYAIFKEMPGRWNFADRWRELRKWDCDPSQTVQELEYGLSLESEQFKQAQRVHHFDPGKITNRYYVGDSLSEYLPSFAYIRFFEQTGAPLQINGISNAAYLAQASSKILPLMECWSPIVLVRALQLQTLMEGKGVLSRPAVASMPNSYIDQLFHFCISSLKREHEPSSAFHTSSQKQLLVSSLIEVVSKIAFRLSKDQLRECFDLSVKYYKTMELPLVNPDIAKKWLNRIFLAADAETLMEWVPTVISLPPIKSRQYDNEGELEDPVLYFPFSKIRNRLDCNSPDLQKSITEMIERLHLISESRKSISSRLTALYRGNLLSELHTNYFGNLLWLHRDLNGLPVGTDLSWHAIATLPHPPEIDIPKLLKTAILNLNPMEGGALQIDDLGNDSCTINSAPAPTFITQSGQNTTSKIRLLDSSPGCLNWSSLERKMLFERFLQWWDTVKHILPKYSDGFFSLDLLGMSESIDHFLFKAILKEPTQNAQIDLMLVKDLLLSMRSCRVFASSSLPYIAISDIDLCKELLLLACDDLNRDDEIAVSMAAESIRHCAQLERLLNLALSPVSMVRNLVNRVIYRRRAGLRNCLIQLSRLIAESPDTVDELQYGALTDSLLLWSIKLNSENDEDSEFASLERPTYKEAVAYLAGTLYSRYSSSESDLPDPIELWRITCETNPLPEVKLAFEQGLSAHDYFVSSNFGHSLGVDQEEEEVNDEFTRE